MNALALFASIFLVSAEAAESSGVRERFRRHPRLLSRADLYYAFFAVNVVLTIFVA